MNRFLPPLFCAALLLQSSAFAQETATPPEGGAPAPTAETTTTTTTETTTVTVDTAAPAPAPLIGPEADAAAKAAQMEMVKRQELSFTATQAITEGEKLYKAGQLDAAAERFKYAIDNLPQTGTSGTAYNRAVAGLALVRADQGDAALKAKNYSSAVALYQEAVSLTPSNSHYKSKLENAKNKLAAYNKSSRDVAGTENNPALTPEVRAKIEETQRLMFEGDRFYDTGQYAAAEVRYMRIIAIDPYNKAARKRLQKLDETRQRSAEKRHAAFRKEAMYQVTKGWSQEVPPDYGLDTTDSKGPDGGGVSRLMQITRKLQDMRIPILNFNQADIQTVIQVLTAKSRELDKTGEGINFVLKTEPTIMPAAAPTAEGGQPAAPAAVPAAAPIPPVTLNLNDAPMIEVLRFISSITGLQVKIEEYAVFLFPPGSDPTLFQTRTFAVPPGFFEGGLRPAARPAGSTATTNVSTVKVDVKQQLVDKGVVFPDGASAAFLAGSSRLVVKNTPEQLDIIDALIKAQNVETPQVEIETRLAEFTDDQLKALTFNYQQFVNVNLSNTPWPDPTVNVRHAGNTALRDQNSGITVNGLDSLLGLQSAGGNPLYPGTTFGPNPANTIALGGTIGGSSFTVLINMIDSLKGVDLLSAPKVTTKSRTRAKIEIIRELRYPTEFERPTVNTTPFQMTNIGGTGIVYLALPATPRQFAVKPIGVIMEVTPTTYPDQRIDLELQPEVTDFEGFINYGQAIRSRSDGISPPPEEEGDVNTPSIVNEPVFNVRQITTKVQVLDGQTVIMGGLIREDRQQIDDKVPILGDIPLVGRAFRSKVEKSTKRNLMIFVTARLVKSDGRALYNQDVALLTAPPPPPPIEMGNPGK